MVEISLSGSGEGPGWATGRGYSTHEPIKPFGRLAHRQTRQYIYLGSTSADRTLVAGNGRRADAGVEGGRSSPQGGRRRRGPRGEDQNET